MGRPFAKGEDSRRGAGNSVPGPRAAKTVRTLARLHQGDAVKVLVELMGMAKDKGGNPLPGAKDEKVRLQAAKVLLEYAAGTPIPMQPATDAEEASSAGEADAATQAMIQPPSLAVVAP